MLQVHWRLGRMHAKIVGLVKEQRWDCSLAKQQPGVFANVLFGYPLNHQRVGSKSRALIVVKVKLLAARTEDNGAVSVRSRTFSQKPCSVA